MTLTVYVKIIKTILKKLAQHIINYVNSYKKQSVYLYEKQRKVTNVYGLSLYTTCFDMH